ncbi:MAG: 50S ribosomal protein L30 [Candidatus Marsarchaeota archaeon]|nr:50S ribosomal protein L30 [Candidatus Marsarchaeota archaeon]
MANVIGIVRIKGTVKVPKHVAETLRRLKLDRRNSMCIQYDTPSIKGMLGLVEPYVAWGELEDELLTDLLVKRGRTRGNHRLTENLTSLGFNTVDELVAAIKAGKLKECVRKGFSSTLRLTPPSGGFKGELKRPASQGGAWGYHKALATLLEQMV